MVINCCSGNISSDQNWAGEGQAISQIAEGNRGKIIFAHQRQPVKHASAVVQLFFLLLLPCHNESQNTSGYKAKARVVPVAQWVKHWTLETWAQFSDLDDSKHTASPASAWEMFRRWQILVGAANLQAATKWRHRRLCTRALAMHFLLNPPAFEGKGAKFIKWNKNPESKG